MANTSSIYKKKNHDPFATFSRANENAFFLRFLFSFFSTCSCFCFVPPRRRKTAEETAIERRHGDHGTFGRCLAVRRGTHIVVHVQPAAASTVGHGVHGRGPGARGTVQLGGAAARQLPAGDQGPVGQVQRFGHGDDHHENGKVSSTTCVLYDTTFRQMTTRCKCARTLSPVVEFILHIVLHTFDV